MFTTVQEKILAIFHVKWRIFPHFLVSNNFLGLCFFLGEKDKKEKNPKIKAFSASCTAACENPGPEAKLWCWVPLSDHLLHFLSGVLNFMPFNFREYSFAVPNMKIMNQKIISFLQTIHYFPFSSLIPTSFSLLPNSIPPIFEVSPQEPLLSLQYLFSEGVLLFRGA